MIVVDANVLLYAHDATDPRQPATARWLASSIDAGEQIGLALMTVLAFVRIATDGRVYERPLAVAEAIGLVTSLLERSNVHLLQPTDGHWRKLADLAARGQARGPLLMDAHLATLTIEHGGRLATTDRDFTRFPGLRMIDPTSA